MKRTIVVLPRLQQKIKDLGEHLRMARLRRRLSALQLCQRAGITRPTLFKIEHGDASVSFAAVANVLFCLGLDKDLEELGRDDELGRRLQDAELVVKRRAPKQPPLA